MNLLKKNDEVKMLTKLFSNQILQKNYLYNFYIEFPLTLAILVALFYRWHRIFGLWFFFVSLHTYNEKKDPWMTALEEVKRFLYSEQKYFAVSSSAIITM